MKLNAGLVLTALAVVAFTLLALGIAVGSVPLLPTGLALYAAGRLFS